jgi:hypothetical protein
MEPPHDKDIRIGEDAWIETGDIPSGAPALEVDPMLRPIEAFVSAFETECVAGCCGICAYLFSPERVKQVVAIDFSHEREALISRLSGIHAALSSSRSEVVVSSRMNQYFSKDTFIRLIEHLIACVKSA